MMTMIRTGSLKYIKQICLVLSFVFTLFVLKPFVNGLGCDFELYDYNERIHYELTCKRGLIYQDIWDKETGQRFVNKSFYGYWNGFTYNLNLGHTIHLKGPDQNVTGSGLSVYQLSSIWTSFNRQNNTNSFSLVEIPKGAIFKSDFSTPPKRGFIE
ncbi:hypothetical protein [Vibrio sagamiensis]|uniref:Uncharacterized protein n=1 Tax=Vibrio sagamiensis NBRC 104589 TaxID=1219064 RepID=A0A511QJH8_9VIBR|nr:hypothetical protein [Vibrio sagamiensis]PNQ53906.1 hypothetical protein C1141_18755 [Vibrio agarivorans]GEM77484.1 hypothetical protein VSA01S_35960 [Vibrio sagamiensis NBRC 104589]